jgi:hypothetical protein
MLCEKRMIKELLTKILLVTSPISIYFIVILELYGYNNLEDINSQLRSWANGMSRDQTIAAPYTSNRDPFFFLNTHEICVLFEGGRERGLRRLQAHSATAVFS